MRHDTGTSAADPAAAASAGGNVWALGDYHRFATQTVWEVGPVVVEACGVRPGQRVLDVAAGTGNVALRAAEAGGRVVAADLTPEHFPAGRRAARARGVEVEWVEADAEDLPFDDGAFDVVTSCFGVMFAPRQQRVADELVRVCRPGGTIGLAAFTPQGLGGDFFAVVGRHAPAPPPDASPPLAWGDPDHVRRLFGDRVAAWDLRRLEYVERAADPDAYVALFFATFGPVIALARGLAADPARAEAFDRDLRDFAVRADRGGPGGSAAYPYEYLLAVGRTAAATS